jgi:hypothetical protein
MKELSVHSEWFDKGVACPVAGWLLPGTIAFSVVLAAALIGAFGAAQPALTGVAVKPELPSIAMIIGASAPQAAPASVTQPSFAFGFLEFDGDPKAPGGVPGFDSLPKHDLRVAEVSPGH